MDNGGFLSRGKRGLQSSLNLHTGQPLTESDHTICCVYTIPSPEDENNIAQNM
jgi:hypothetical protein